MFAQEWVRLRLRQAGIPRPTSIHLVSSSKSAGVRDLVRSLHKSVGLRYDVWVVRPRACSRMHGRSTLHPLYQNQVPSHQQCPLQTAAAPCDFEVPKVPAKHASDISRRVLHMPQPALILCRFSCHTIVCYFARACVACFVPLHYLTMLWSRPALPV